MNDPVQNPPLNSSPRRRSFWQKLRRIVLYALAVFVILIVLAIVGLRIAYPPDRLRAMVTQTTEEQFKRHLHVGPVYLNPFRGLEFSDIRLSPLADSVEQGDLFPIRLVSIKKIILKYSFSELLHKRIRINEIVIDSPTLEYFVDLSTPSNLRVPDMPLLVNLDMLRIKNAQFKIILADTVLEQRIFIGDMELSLADLRLPKGKIVKQGEKVYGRCQLSCPNTDFSFAQSSVAGGVTSSISLKSKLDLQTDLTVQGFKNIDLRMRLELDRPNFSMRESENAAGNISADIPFPIVLELATRANMEQDSIRIDRLAFQMDHQDWIDIAGEVKNALIDPKMSLAVKESKIPVRQLLDLAGLFVPDSVIKPIRLLNNETAFSLKGSALSGLLPTSKNGEGLRFIAQLSLNDFGMSWNDDALRLNGLNTRYKFAGLVNGSGLAGLMADLSIKCKSLSSLPPGGTPVRSDGGYMSAMIHFNERMIPLSAACSLSVANAFGASLGGRIDLTGSNRLHKLRGNGHLLLSNVYLDSLPESTIHSRAAARLDFGLNTLDDLFADLKVETDSLVMGAGEERIALAPLIFQAHINGRADTAFADIHLDSVSMQLNNIVRGSASGEITDWGRKFSFKVPNLQLSHLALLNYLPERMKEQMEDLTLTGFTRLTARAEGSLASAKPEYNLSAHIFTDQTNFGNPAQFLTVDGIKVDVSASVNSEIGSIVEMSLGTDRIRYDAATPLVLRNNEMRLTLTSGDFASLQIKDGRIDFPDVKTRGNFSAQVDDLSGNPITALQMDLSFLAEDTLAVLPGVLLKGSGSLSCNVNMDTVLADVQAQVKLNDLTLFLPTETRVRNINADVFMHQQIDLVKGAILGSAESTIATPTDGSIDYLVFRSYYRNSLPNLSYLNIGKIEASGYVIDNFRLEFYLGEGRLEIPLLMANLYNGNLGGRMSLDLAAGDLAEATYKISSHFSGINSDLLLPQFTRKETQGMINGNMELSGKGLDPEKPIDLLGHFYITEIGPKVADNLLRSLDPQGTDAGIRSTRLLINRGFKPKLMTFEIRHGYFYPAIQFAQPWYFPVRLSGGRIELSRIPVAFFIQMATQQVAGGG
jgi:hypothetical protein